MTKETLSVKMGQEEIVLETGTIARQANGAVILRAGETLLLSTVCAAPEPTPNLEFQPLRVDFQEKFSSAGKTLGGFIKREGKPSERETLISRLIDRPVRPMFEEGYCHETQILTYVFSYDGLHATEPLAICASSAALVISDIPLLRPIGAVRVGKIGERFIVNPTIDEQKESTLDLILAGTEQSVLMIEGYCQFLTEEEVLQAIEIGHKEIQNFCRALSDWQKRVGKPKNLETLYKLPEGLSSAVSAMVEEPLKEIFQIQEKKLREKALSELRKKVDEALKDETREPHYEKGDIAYAYKKISAHVLRDMVHKKKIRADGRKTTDIRPISIEQGLLPRVHGSSLFTRGETQSLAVCTLGGESMAQRFEDLHGEGARRFYLQYFFPPYSVGEVGRMGPPGRREVGHGKLAERSLGAILPTKEQFPYIIRLESNITESNGSSSMASVCGGCLAMMDAGIPITRPVAGIAMGLILEEDGYTILSDILGVEDSLGDMDFKVAGNTEGITAFQMDIKVDGITIDIMRDALMQAKDGRIHILKKMIEACPQPRRELSIYAPRIEHMLIKPSKIGGLIGPGGKTIRSIIEETGVEIDINDDGTVCITSQDAVRIEKAKAIIHGLTAEVEVGQIYTGKATSVMPFGVFVELLPGKEGLCHISEFDTFHIQNMADYVKIGDDVTVKVLDIDERGKIRLSRRALLGKKS